MERRYSRSNFEVPAPAISETEYAVPRATLGQASLVMAGRALDLMSCPQDHHLVGLPGDQFQDNYRCLHGS